MNFWFIFGVFILTIKALHGHEFKWGLCPDVEPLEEFDISQYLGKWYTIEKTRSISSCISYTFLDVNGSYFVKESSRPLGISIPYIFENYVQIGVLKVPNPKKPARMTVAFPFSLLPNFPVSFWVLDTDYVTYALMWSCRPLIFGHAQSAMILSRQPTLGRDLVNKLRDKLDYFGINKYKLTYIDQERCRHNRTLSPSDLDHSFEDPVYNDSFAELKAKTSTHSSTDETTMTQTIFLLPTANDADNEP